MNIARAHSYEHIAILRHELEQVPRHWLDAVAHYKWFVYPADLSPVWTGLVIEDWTRYNNLGYTFDQVAGWCAWKPHHRWLRETPHIFLQHPHIAWAAIHEIGHALSQAWYTPIEEFFNPDAAFNDYMASNPDEYFACAVEAFLRPARDDVHWNCSDLADRDEKLWRYLTAKLTA